jgi:hypothetical protein
MSVDKDGRLTPAYYTEALPRLIEKAWTKACEYEQAMYACSGAGDFGGSAASRSLMNSYLEEAAELETKLIQWKRFNHEV